MSVKFWIYGLLGLIAFLFFLFVNLPASVAHRMLASNLGPLQLTGVSGTIWTGRANTLRFNDLRLDSIGWEIQPGELLAGALKGRFFLGNSDRLGGRGRFLAQDERNLALSQAQGWIDLASEEARPLGVPQGLGGIVRINLEAFAIEENRIVALEGDAKASDLRLGPPWGVSLGDLQMRFASMEGGGVRIALNDLARGPLFLDVAGQISATGRYGIKGWAGVRHDSAERLTAMLRQSFGEPDEGGRFRVNLAGFFESWPG